MTLDEATFAMERKAVVEYHNPRLYIEHSKNYFISGITKRFEDGKFVYTLELKQLNANSVVITNLEAVSL